MARPQIDMTHVYIHNFSFGKIRFSHAGSVFEFDVIEEELEDGSDPVCFNLSASAHFNRFLEYIGHPQRIFSIDDGSYFWEKETGVFLCADKARFPELIRQLNEISDLAIKVEMPSLSPPAKNKVLNNLCRYCIDYDHDGNYPALDDYSDRLVECYKTSPQEAISPATQALIVQAMSLKASYLKRLGHRAEERASYEFIVENFGQNSALSATVGKAWSELGSMFLRDAKVAWNDVSSARNLLQKARTALETAHEKKPHSGTELGNLAYVLWLSGETQNAEMTLRRAFSMPFESGKWLFETMCADSATHPIPPDAGFREFLRRIWQETETSA
jgi:hypothetical protein